MQKLPSPQHSGSQAGVHYWDRPLKPSHAVEDYVKVMNKAVKDLSSLFQSHVDGKHKLQKDFSFVAPPLAMLSLALSDVNFAILHKTAEIEDYDVMGRRLDKFVKRATPLVKALVALKTAPEVSPKLLKRVVGILQAFTVSFDQFYQLLKVTGFAAARHVFANEILEVICAIDGTIAAFDAGATLTDEAFCQQLQKPKCDDWNSLPKKAPAIEACPSKDTREYLYWAFKTQCFDVSCQTDDWCKSLPTGFDACKWKPTPDQYFCNNKQATSLQCRS
ncbi:hypothetical protein CBS101457_006148 [Exobasidium rhododendri]|nr:hypothetical protein CBS101457_006148 [Exobasidium rhododendri]